MSAMVWGYIAMVVGPALTSTARPAMTVLAIQVASFVAVGEGWASLPGELELLISVPAMGLVAVLACLEMVAAADEEIDALMRELKVHRVTGSLATGASAMLMTLVGAEEGGEVMGDEATATLLEGVAMAAESELAMEWQVAVVVGALGLHLAAAWARSKVLGLMYEVELSRWWARLESGGVLIALILLPIFPLAVVTMLVVWMVAMAVTAVAVEQVKAMLDGRNRRECEGCGYLLRREALRCPECGRKRQPESFKESP